MQRIGVFVSFTLCYSISIAQVPTNDMVGVSGGTFQMGSNIDDGAGPPHSVTVGSFSIDKFEITYDKWTEVRNWALTHGYAATDIAAGSNGTKPVGPDNPVTVVNWYDVVKWCNARSEEDGLTPVYYSSNTLSTVYRTGQLDLAADAVKWTANGYRLPTEAEWEFAARGGNLTHGYTYSGGDTLEDVAWCDYNSGNTTHQVGTKNPNELGIYDMSGNVAEWCWDWYGPYSGDAQMDPKGATSGANRILRGGSFYYYFTYVTRTFRVANRETGSSFGWPPDRRYNTFGFRCVNLQALSNLGSARDFDAVPSDFYLGQNYPNPFNPSTTIRYGLPTRSHVTLTVFNTLGQEVAQLVNGDLEAGYHEVRFDASGLSSGVYFYRLQAGTYVETRKLLLLR
jgi:formylglycine-generating enzyme required for sulfatase activity